MQTNINQAQTSLRDLYMSSFPVVALIVKKYGGGLEDARDVFHDAMLTWLELPQEKRTQVDNVTAYLAAIARNNWFRRIEKMEKEREAALMPEEDEFRVSNALYNLLLTTGKKCMDLLQAFYYEHRNPAQIAEAFGLSGAHSASAQKYKCLEKLRQQVKAANHRKEDFYEN